VSESELAPAAESAMLRKRTRVRSLLKPAQGRRKRTVGAMA
jgi:hypothetical protein